MRLNAIFSIIFFITFVLINNLHAIEYQQENYARTPLSHISYKLKQLKYYLKQLPTNGIKKLQRIHFRLRFALVGLFSKKDNDPECACFFIQRDNPGTRDAISSGLLNAIAQRESHIFVSYECWDQLLQILKKMKEEFHKTFDKFGIVDPEKQIYIESPILVQNLDPDVETKLKEKKVISFKELGIISVQQATQKHGITTFVGPTVEQLVKMGLAPTFENFRKNITNVIDSDIRTNFPFILFNPNDWQIYDTNLGLYYLHPKLEKENNLIATNNFTLIQDPFQNIPKKRSLEQIPQEIDFRQLPQPDWVNNLHQIFRPSNKEWHISFLGHGLQRRTIMMSEIAGTTKFEGTTTSSGQIAGMPECDFGKILLFLQNYLNTKRVGIMSCFTPAWRIIHLMHDLYKLNVLKFDIITPVDDTIPALQRGLRLEIKEYIPSFNQSNATITTQTTTLDMSNALRICKRIPSFSKELECLVERNLEASTDIYSNRPSIIYAHTTKMIPIGPPKERSIFSYL